MNYTSLIGKSFSIFLKNIKDFIIVIVVFMILGAVLDTIGPSEGILENPMRMLGRRNIFNRGRGLGNMTLFAYDYLRSLILNIFLGANFMALLDLLRGYSYGVLEIKDKIVNYASVLVPVAAIYTLVAKIIGIVPIIGGILGIVAYFALIFTFFLIEDYSDMDTVDYLKFSYELTKGHKLKLAILTLLINILPIIIIILLIGIISPLIFLGGISFLYIPIILVFILPIFTSTMMTMLAISIYYEENLVK